MKSAALQAAIFGCYVIATVALAALVFVAWALTELYRLKGWPADAPERSNCWAVAVPLWLREPEESCLVIDKSRHTFVPHVRFAASIDELEVIEYLPIRPRRGVRGFIDSLWFRGRLRKGRGRAGNGKGD